MGVWVRRRKNRKGSPWGVVYDDHTGRRRLETFGPGASGKERAETRASELRLQLRQAATTPTMDPDITLRAFCDRWLAKADAGLADKSGHKRGTVITYRNQLEKHVYPEIGDQRIRDLHRGNIAAFLERKRLSPKLHGKGNLSESTVATIYRILRAMLSRACFEGIILVNPANALWSNLATTTRRRQKDRAVDQANVMSRAEVDRLFSAADGQERVMLATKYRAGLRMGELVALRLADVDIPGKRLRVRESLMDKRPGLSVEDRLDDPKSGSSRWVSIGKVLVEILRDHIAARERENFAHGWRNGRASWLFHRNGGIPVNGAHLRFRFSLIAKKAGLPAHLTPHSLRHSYATHMLSRGQSIVWVAQQLGHSSPKITLDRYAWSIPSENQGAADALDGIVLGVAQEQGTRRDLGTTVISGDAVDIGRQTGLEDMTGIQRRSNLADKSTRNSATPAKPGDEDGGGSL